ncbi:MAG: hemolysin-type calcium-binding repeat family protein [Rhizobium sp.]|nr:hemolysin-type calcium-binding repeat family protein [Rhizobium sp.]
MVTIKGKNYESVVVRESDTTFVIDEKAELYSGGEISEDDLFYAYAIVEDVSASPDNNTYKINGHVLGMAGGIMTSGINTTIRVGKGAEVSSALSILGGGGLGAFGGAIATTGENSRVIIAKGAEVSGLFGVVIGGADSTATNSGVIEGSMMGMIAGDISGGVGLTDMKLVNNGRIESMFGMLAIGVDGAIVENGKNGEIIGFSVGMAAATMDDTQSSTINNFGTVRVTMSVPLEDMPPGGGIFLGTTAAILGGLGDDTVRNSGVVYGHIVLGGGDDSLDNRGGKIVGQILGGEGDDTLIVGKAGDDLVELDAQGFDTVRSAFTYMLADFVESLVLTGKKDIDGTGNDLDNMLTGNNGDNDLTGGAGIDTFVFGTKGGKDAITDFTLVDDILDISGWTGMTDLAALKLHATQKGDDVVIKSGADVLVLADHVLADLDSVDLSVVYALA